MYISLHQLTKLPVFTQSGVKVGTVHDLEIDVETHAIRHYIVEHGILGKDYYWVAPVQIQSIDAEKIIVVDAIVTDPEFKIAKGDAPPAAPVEGVTPTQLTKTYGRTL